MTTRAYLSDAPAVTVVLVVVVLALVILPLVQLLGDGAGAQHGLEPLLEMAAVLLGLLVVSVSLHALEAHEQARANVLVVGVGVAAACNFLHGVLVHSGPVHMPVGSAYISLWLSSWARIAEVATLGLTATRLAAPGPPGPGWRFRAASRWWWWDRPWVPCRAGLRRLLVACCGRCWRPCWHWRWW